MCFQFTGLHTINLEKQEKKKTPVSARDQTTNHYACRVGKCPLWYFTFHLNSPNLKQNQKQDVKACSVAEHQNFKRIANFSTLPWINTNKQRKQSILKFIPLFLKRVVISSTRLISKKFPHFLSPNTTQHKYFLSSTKFNEKNNRSHACIECNHNHSFPTKLTPRNFDN